MLKSMRPYFFIKIGGKEMIKDEKNEILEKDYFNEKKLKKQLDKIKIRLWSMLIVK